MAEEDLLWGKRRHLFGGIEPSNMIKFAAVMTDMGVTIEAQLPNDTVIDGQTLCSVAGAVIRRKTNDYPKDEFDGDLVADIKMSTILTDPVDDTSGSYYYAAFPYTGQDVYNRNTVNRTGVNLPKSMINFTAESTYNYLTDSSTIHLNVALPEGVEGAIIRKSTVTYPTNETEGEECMTVTSDGVYADTDVSIGTIYYYSAFPYNSSGAYNRDTVNFLNIPCVKHNYLFGFDINLSDSNPNTRVTYPSDVDNANYTPAFMNLDTEKFNYGSWNIAPGEKFMPKPCMLNYDGTVAHYLNPNDYSKREDGVTASKVADIGFEGNAMMEWPKIYTHREEVNGVYKFRCSDTKLGADWDCWCNYDINDNEIEHFYTSIYTVCCPNENATTGTRLRSISGQTIWTAEYYSTTRSYAKYRVNSSDKYDSWDIGLLADHLLIQDLLVLMCKSTDCSGKYGVADYYNTNYKAKTTGNMDNLGLFACVQRTATEPSLGVKVFGMEHYWGNDWRHIAGWAIYNGKQYIKITKGAHDGIGATSDTAGTKYNRFDAGYSNKKCIVNANFATTTGYWGSSVTTEYGRFPTNANGALSTYECDIVKWSNSSSNNVGMVGGDANYTMEAGPFAVQAYNSQTSTSYQTTTLSCKPVLVAQ
jgi:hypothetical protein